MVIFFILWVLCAALAHGLYFADTIGTFGPCIYLDYEKIRENPVPFAYLNYKECRRNSLIIGIIGGPFSLIACLAHLITEYGIYAFKHGMRFF